MTSRINGRTLLAGIIGDPLDHTLSPAMHNAAYESLGLDWAYLPFRLSDETDVMRFLGAARVLPFVGFNVTMPFKQDILSMCDEVAMMAKMAGAVNTVHVVDGRFIGYNTDGRGLMESLESETGFVPEGKQIAIVGAGGAAGSAALSLMLGKASRLSIVNRNLDRADDLASRLITHARSTEIDTCELIAAGSLVRDADLVINATPLGMKPGDHSPVPVEWLRPGQVVCDMIYKAEDTPLLVVAKTAGATAIDGLGMLVAQGAIAIDIWSDSAQISTPRDVMRDAADTALRAAPRYPETRPQP